jgi:SAM-dependent methyltransferase
MVTFPKGWSGKWVVHSFLKKKYAFFDKDGLRIDEDIDIEEDVDNDINDDNIIIDVNNKTKSDDSNESMENYIHTKKKIKTNISIDNEFKVEKEIINVNLNHLQEYYNNDAIERNEKDIVKWKENERDRFMNLMEENNTNLILELGCGTGRDAKYFESNLKAKVTCLDFSMNMIEECKKKGLQNAYICDFTKLPLIFPDNNGQQYDAIYTMNSLLHVPKEVLPNIIIELTKMLKKNGLIYIGMYGGENFEGRWRLDPSGLNRFFSYYTDKDILKIFSENDLFDIDFNIVEPNFKNSVNNMHFQSIILTKKN